ncbi:hypothetical protein ACFX19_007508 [Malus domestica]
MTEAHVTNSSNHKRRKNCRGRGNGWQALPRAQGQQSQGSYKGENLTQKRQPHALKAPNFKNKGKTTIQSSFTKMDMCYRCGSKDHWSHICRATHEAIVKYHSRRESNFAYVEHPENATTSMKISDFQDA